ncbi:MAG: CHAD domain-containing protein [Anaerolineae bacterium]|nr:CHAD domain-containing protein [Anaerolineae bacterium]
MTQRFHLTLTDEERAVLNDILQSGTARLQRRAQIILLTADEVPQTEIASAAGLSVRQVRRWQHAFVADRMAIFEPHPHQADPPQESQPAGAAPRHPVPNFAAGAPASAGSALTEVNIPDIPEPTPPRKPRPQPVPGRDVPRRALELANKPGILPDDPMSEAGRKALLYHFERMLLNEPGSRLGEDIEAVHDMRVATRRMRSALRIFEPYYRRKVIRPFIRGLRHTARALGDVRDMDVFIEKLGVYQAGLPENGEHSLEPLLEMCQQRREQARTALIGHLNSPEFVTFVEGFDRFLTTPGAGALSADGLEGGSPPAYLVRHVVPRLIYTNYETVRAYETVLDHARIETLHALRIEFKRLRYALEFFEEVLGPEAKTVISEVKGVQDHLGDLNDAQVAGDFLRDFISKYEKNQSGVLLQDRRSIERVVQYMAYQFAEKHRLTTTFPEVWAQFNRPEIRRALALSISAL